MFNIIFMLSVIVGPYSLWSFAPTSFQLCLMYDKHSVIVVMSELVGSSHIIRSIIIWRIVISLPHIFHGRPTRPWYHIMVTLPGIVIKLVSYSNEMLFYIVRIWRMSIRSTACALWVLVCDRIIWYVPIHDDYHHHPFVRYLFHESWHVFQSPGHITIMCYH